MNHFVYIIGVLFLELIIQAQGQQGIWPGIVETKEKKCTMFGRCKEMDDGRILNCYVEHGPKPIGAAALKNLTRFCPEMLEMYGTDELCCKEDQIDDLVTQLGMPESIIARCPSCWYNFRQSLCEFTCSPYQAHFIKVNKFFNETDPVTGDVTVMAEDLDFYMENRHAQDTYDSCKSVVMGTANSLAMDFLCGSWGSYRCTPQRWFDFMGSVTNGYAPFNIFYRLVNSTSDAISSLGLGSGLFQTDVVPYNGDTYPCNSPPLGSNRTCSCVDCELSCPGGSRNDVQLPPKETIDDWQIAFTFGMYFIMGIVFIVGSVLIVLLAILARRQELRKAKEGYSTKTKNEPSLFHRLGQKSEQMINGFFRNLAETCAAHPIAILVPGILITGGLSCGIVYLEITTDPVELWASPTSRSRMEKDYYDQNFSPFYRTQQIIVTAKGLPNISYYASNNFQEEPESYGPIFNKEFMYALLDLQERILNDVKGVNNETLRDVCFTPLAPDNTNCTIFSYLEYWQSNPANFEVTKDYTTVIGGESVTLTDNYLDHFQFCSRNPASPKDSTAMKQSCQGRYGGLIDPAVVFGGFLEPGKPLIDPPYKNATTAVITFIINNNFKKDDNRAAREWEKAYVDFMKNYLENEKPSFLEIAFSSERSIEDELERQSSGEVVTVVVSYMIMFIYISIALGEVNSWSRLFVDSKISAGIVGVVIVVGSVGASVGLFGFAGVPATLIIIEVIPFLVLAVGVDNIFIMVQTYQRSPRLKGETQAQHIGRVVGEVSPSMLLNSFTDSASFFLGGLSGMPAVRTFAFYAGVALMINFILQFTCFVSFLSLDISRQESNRFDILCCVKAKDQETEDNKENKGFLHKLIESVYAPFLFTFPVRVLVLVVFFGWLCVSIGVAPKVEAGLEQELSVPTDSHVLDYFKAMNEYLSVGPPVYFVLRDTGIDYSDKKTQELIRAGEFPYSLVSQIYSASRISNRTYISKPAQSWLDDYLDWAGTEDCCKYESDTGYHCASIRTDPNCFTCGLGEIVKEEQINGELFERYLSWFLNDNPHEKCAKGGHAAYSLGVTYDTNMTSGYSKAKASYFMTYHNILKNSKDFIEAMREARTIADNITATLRRELNSDLPEVFPYSIFYVYYEQYLTIWRDAIVSLSISFVTIFVISFFLMGFNLGSALVIIVTIFMIVMDLIGMLYFWNISLNAVTLVNLVMAVGIATEFCTHLIHHFVMSQEMMNLDRARDSLVNIGVSVLSGITLTKFGMVVIGATHGLIFLPVLLSFVGPPSRRVTHQ